MTNDFIQQTKKLVSEKQKIVILSHKNPDGDALGAGLALYHYLVGLQKEVNFIVPNQLPLYLKWMPEISKVLMYNTAREKGKNLLSEAELIIMADFNHESRLDEMAEQVLESQVPKILIDHHPNPQPMADYIYSRTSSSSTAEMMFEFLSALSGQTLFSKEIAECLYVGIMSDTGSFSYNSSNPLTFKIIGHLLEAGINKDEITDRVYNNFSAHRLKLLGYALNQKMKVLPHLGTAYISLSLADLERYRFESGDTEGFVNYPLSIKGIVFSAIFIEKDDFTKCSFRSKNDFPANKVSKEHFNGGGHLNAAGGTSQASLEETVKKFEAVLPQYKNYLNL